ncbi:beta-mannosidase [Flavobacterium sp. 7E]|uniref:glycoside hydrolase family 2 protein n=1 Tax=Flavobacterium sp. 7E TaxID=2735898 RepID=UPI001570D1F6|nr:glycoside hydrolase family 2 protein [Flavobacterium sp. 7E]NRS89275.1 beta-mannosidase [Flavobacterium sp. 7E]
MKNRNVKRERFNFVIVLLVLLCVVSCHKIPNTINQNLDTNWSFKSVQDSLWMPATVPGSVHTDLISNGIIEDPFDRLNEKDIQWIDKKDWEYESSFKVDNSIFEKEKIELNFKGLDTYATVYLNDSLLLKTDNIFVGWQVDCKQFLKLGKNQLKIVFDSPVNVGLKMREDLGYQLPNAVNDQSENGGLGKKQVAVFSRKPGYHFGWDWGPRLVTSGIWQDIELNAWDNATIEDVYIKQKEISTELAVLSAEIEIIATHNFNSEVIIKVDSVLAIQKTIQLKKGINKFKIPLEIKNPSLWWTNGLGTQKLYKIEVELKKDKELVASNSKNIGIKTLKVIQQKDSVGESFYFELNGHPVFMKGANYIPQDVFLNRISVEDYEEVVNNMVEANYNMIRIWGGGIYEKEIFYDLCDQKGILVWQDFMFACAMYPGDVAFLQNVKKEAIYTVKRLRNHTSIALWCGNNENLTAWKNWGWINEIVNTQGQEVVDKVWKGYTDVFHKILPQVVEELDNDTFYWASSPTSARGVDATYTSGDYHYWKVWGNQAPISTYNEAIPRFMSEYGFQSFPEFSSVKKYTEKQDWDIYSEVMESHQRSNIGNKNIEFYMDPMYKKPKDFQSFLYVSQLLQAKAMKIAIEAHRRNMPYCMGSLYWQINDCWPVASWSSIDYYGNWKASHFKVKDLYKSVKTMFFEKDNQLEIHIVSDDLKNKTANLKVALMNFQGDVLDNFEIPINIKSNSSNIYFKSELHKLLKENKRANMFIVAELINENKDVFDESLFFFENPKTLALTKPTFNLTVRKKENEGLVVEIISDVLAKDVRVNTTVAGRFSNNYFDMVPNKKYEIYFDSKEKIELEKFKKTLGTLSLYNSYEK